MLITNWTLLAVYFSFWDGIHQCILHANFSINPYCPAKENKPMKIHGFPRYVPLLDMYKALKNAILPQWLIVDVWSLDSFVSRVPLAYCRVFHFRTFFAFKWNRIVLLRVHIIFPCTSNKSRLAIIHLDFMTLFAIRHITRIDLVLAQENWFCRMKTPIKVATKSKSTNKHASFHLFQISLEYSQMCLQSTIRNDRKSKKTYETKSVTTD